MRTDFTPQVETREIADSELDNISGGIAAGVSGLGYGAGVEVGDVLGTVESIVPVSAITGLVSVHTAGLGL